MTVFHHRMLAIFLKNFAQFSIVFFVLQAVWILPDRLGNLSGNQFATGAGVLLSVRLFLNILDQFLPLALLLATLFTVGPLARGRQLVALGGAGLSMWQIMWPIISVAGVAVVFSGILRLTGFSMVFDPVLNSIPLTPAGETALQIDHAYPLVNLFAVLIGIIMGSSARRITIYGDFGRALFILFLYFMITRAMVMAGSYQWFPPLVAGWMGTVVFIAFITISWLRMKS